MRPGLVLQFRGPVLDEDLQKVQGPEVDGLGGLGVGLPESWPLNPNPRT